MDKWELIEITLDQLIEQWKANKEQFDIDVSNGEVQLETHNYAEMSISWCPTILNDKSADKISTDPIKMRKGVMISYRRGNGFRCYIFKINGMTKRPADGALSENSISASKSLTPIRSLYRKFMRLRSDIAAYKRHKANSSYLTNLCGVFPGTLDGHILGSADEEDNT